MRSTISPQSAGARPGPSATIGALRISLHHGGGVGMGLSQHARLVIVCDGTEAAARRLARRAAKELAALNSVPS